MNLQVQRKKNGIQTNFGEMVWNSIIKTQETDFENIQYFNKQHELYGESNFIERASEIKKEKPHTIRPLNFRWSTNLKGKKKGWYWIKNVDSENIEAALEYIDNWKYYRQNCQGKIVISKARYYPEQYIKPMFWTGKPYQSSPFQFAPSFQLKDVFTCRIKTEIGKILEIYIDEEKIKPQAIISLARNDGFDGVNRFDNSNKLVMSDWFKKDFFGQILIWDEKCLSSYE